MKIQFKVLVLLIGVVVTMYAELVLYSFFQRSSLISLFRTEQANTQGIFDRMLALQSRGIESLARDYTTWDDMAAYVRSGDIAWAHSNLDSILGTFKVDAFWAYRVDGTLLYSLNGMQDSRLDALALDPRQLFKGRSIVHFFVQTALGPCEIYAATIHPTADTGRIMPTAGYFLIGRLWNAAYLRELSDLTTGEVSLIGTRENRPAFKQGESYETGVVTIRQPLRGWNGKPAATLQIRIQSRLLRDFNKQLKQSIVFFFIIGMILVICVCVFLYRWLGRPLRLVSASLENDDPSGLRPLEKSRDEFGAIARLISNFFLQHEQMQREIGERREAEEKISRAAREWRSTFDCINDQISVMDTEYRIVRVNHAFARQFNMRYDEIVGKVCYELLGRDKICPRCPHRRAMKHNAPSTSEYFISEEGRFREVTCSPIVNDAGTLMGSVHVVTDVTERKDMEKKQRLALLGKLVADMAHEVNNPLMIISGRGQLSLMEDIQSPELIGNLTIIVDECQRAKEIIQRLLKFAKPGAKDLRHADVHASIDAVIHLIEHQFSLDGITFVCRLMETPPFVIIDERQMQEVLMNLFNNAREAMPKSGTITVTTLRSDDRLRIEIKDTGIGMTPEVKKKLFEPFFTTRERGTGLGLSVCFGIIKSFGGNLSFDSEPHTGTTAIITLPVMQGQ